MTINPNSKGLRVLSLRAPLYVRGSFMQPDVSIDKGVLAMKAGGAIALAAVAPAALVPGGPGPFDQYWTGRRQRVRQSIGRCPRQTGSTPAGQDLPQKS